MNEYEEIAVKERQIEMGDTLTTLLVVAAPFSHTRGDY